MAKNGKGGPVATVAAPEGKTARNGLAVVQGGAPAVVPATAAPVAESDLGPVPAGVERVGRGAPVVVAARAGDRPPVFRAGDTAASPGLKVEPDLWAGTAGPVAWAGDMVSNGRWAFHVSALANSDKVLVMAERGMRQIHGRACKALGIDSELRPVHQNGPARAQLVAMLTPAAEGAPVRRTALVFDDQAEADAAGLPSSFYRVYIGTGADGSPAVLLFPDGYVQHLGDPPALWPSNVRGCWTDGGWIAMFHGGKNLADTAAKLADTVATLTRATAAPATGPGT